MISFAFRKDRRDRLVTVVVRTRPHRDRRHGPRSPPGWPASSAWSPRRAPPGPRKRWRARDLCLDLPPNAPIDAPSLAERHADGWYETRKQTVVFIDRDGDGYRALSRSVSTSAAACTGTTATKQFQCPCHGGVYDRDGRVVAGPPPRAARAAERARESADVRPRGRAVKRLAAGSRSTGSTTAPAFRTHPASRCSTSRCRRAPAGGSRSAACCCSASACRSSRASRSRCTTRRRPITRGTASASSRRASAAARSCAACITGAPASSSSRRSLHLVRVVFFGSYRKPRELNWIVGLDSAAGDPRVRADRLPAAVGSARVLGDGRHDQHLQADAGRGREWWRRCCAADRTSAR